MSDEPGAFYAEDKSGRRLSIPALITRRPLERIKRAINFDRIELAAREVQFETVRQLFWIENAAPWRVSPPGNPNVQVLPAPFLRRPGQMITRESCHKT